MVSSLSRYQMQHFLSSATEAQITGQTGLSCAMRTQTVQPCRRLSASGCTGRSLREVARKMKPFGISMR